MAAPEFSSDRPLPTQNQPVISDSPGVFTTPWWNWLRWVDEQIRKIVGQVPTEQTVEITDWMFVYIEYVEDREYPIARNLPFPIKIKKLTTKCRSGTTIAGVRVNGTLIGSTNSVSTSEVVSSQNYTTATGDDATLSVGGTSNCEGLEAAIEYTREQTQLGYA